MKKETILSEIRKYIINEADIQRQIAEGEGIEFSYTGELVPFEVVEGKFRQFIKEILDEIETMKFCVYCRASPQLCKCNHKIKSAVWSDILTEIIKQKSGDKLR